MEAPFSAQAHLSSNEPMFSYPSLQMAHSFLQNFSLQTADQALPKDSTSLMMFDLPRPRDFSFPLPQSFIITELFLVGCNSVISPNRYKFSDSVCRSDSDGNNFEYNFPPKHLFRQ